MKVFFVWILIISSFFFIIKTVSSKERFFTKITIASFLFIVSCIGLIAIIADGWEAGRRPKIEDEMTHPVKSIYFKNETNQTISIIIDFEYSKTEINTNKNINIQFNKIDTIINLKNNLNESFQTPIPFNDRILSFPQNFNIKIIDSIGKTIKIYNKQNFLKNIENPQYKNIIDEEKKASNWDFKIKIK